MLKSKRAWYLKSHARAILLHSKRLEKADKTNRFLRDAIFLSDVHFSKCMSDVLRVCKQCVNGLNYGRGQPCIANYDTISCIIIIDCLCRLSKVILSFLKRPEDEARSIKSLHFGVLHTSSIICQASKKASSGCTLCKKKPIHR